MQCLIYHAMARAEICSIYDKYLSILVREILPRLISFLIEDESLVLFVTQRSSWKTDQNFSSSKWHYKVICEEVKNPNNFMKTAYDSDQTDQQLTVKL